MPARSWACLARATALFIAAASFLLQGQNQPGAHVSPNADRGQAFFQLKCAICHTVGHGTLVGPDLLGVTRRRKHAWLITMIQRPESLLSRQDPIAVALLKKYTVRMPELKVTDAERDDLIAYFEAQAAAHEKAAAANDAGADGSPHR
jgi:protein SCO1